MYPWSVKIESTHEPGSGTWTHILADPAAGVAAIIDPVWVYDAVSGCTSRAFIDQVLQKVSAMGCRVAWVLETHAHADHLSAGALLRKELGARIAIGKGICSVQENFRKVFALDDLPVDGSQFDRLLQEGDRIELGEIVIDVIETPGHTDDSITYLAGGAAFIGDTLFAPDFGTARCDFPGGAAARLYQSIQKLYALPAETRLYLCHDYPKDGAKPKDHVTVAESRAQNIHVQADTEAESFVVMREARDAKLALPKLIFPSVQVNIQAGEPPLSQGGKAGYIKIPFDTSIAELLEDK